MRIQWAVTGSAAGALAAVWLSANGAAAQTSGAPRLSLSAPAECPSAAAFRDEVGLLTGLPGDPFNPSSHDEIRVVITRTSTGFHGSVQFFPEGAPPWPAQEKDHRLCEVLYRWAPRLASEHIPEAVSAPPELPAPDPQHPAAPPAPDGSASPEPPSLPGQVTTKAAEPPILRHEPPPVLPRPSFLARQLMDVSIVVSAGALLTAGVTDTVGGGAQIGAEVRGEMFSLGLEYRSTFPGPVVARQAVNPAWETHPVTFDYTQMTLSLLPCLRFATYFSGCGVIAGMLAITNDYYQPEVDPVFALGPRFVAELPLGERFALFGYAEALFIPQPRFQGYADKSQNVIWEQSPVSGFFGLGASVKFK